MKWIKAYTYSFVVMAVFNLFVSSAYSESKYYQIESGTWRLKDTKGNTILEDARSVVKTDLSSTTVISSIIPYDVDLSGKHKTQLVLFAEYDWNLIPGRGDAKYNSCIVVFNNELKPIYSFELRSRGPNLYMGSLGKGRPTVIGVKIDLAGSADVATWRFYQWDGHEFHVVLEKQVGSCQSVPQFIDINNDGVNEIFFDIHSKYQERLDEVYSWNEKHGNYVDGVPNSIDVSKAKRGDKSPDFWQERIDGEMSRLRAARPGEGIYAHIERCTGFLLKRGGRKDVEPFLQIVSEKLEPIIKNDRNNTHQMRSSLLKVAVFYCLRHPDRVGGEYVDYFFPVNWLDGNLSSPDDRNWEFMHLNDPVLTNSIQARMFSGEYGGVFKDVCDKFNNKDISLCTDGDQSRQASMTGPRALFLRGLTCLEKGDRRKGLGYIYEALRLWPDYPAIYEWMAIEYSEPETIGLVKRLMNKRMMARYGEDTGLK